MRNAIANTTTPIGYSNVPNSVLMEGKMQRIPDLANSINFPSLRGQKSALAFTSPNQSELQHRIPSQLKRATVSPDRDHTHCGEDTRRNASLGILRGPRSPDRILLSVASCRGESNLRWPVCTPNFRV